VDILGKKGKKAKRKMKKKLARKLDPPEVGTQYDRRDEGYDRQQGDQRGDRWDEGPAGSMRQPDYPEDARTVQRTPREDRKRKSAIKKKTIKAMHVEVNRRIAAVGAEQTVLDETMTDQEKFVQLTRQTGNIGDTLAGINPEPRLIHSELIRLMALSAAWAQSLADKSARR
jgi:hypothetical protein